MANGPPLSQECANTAAPNKPAVFPDLTKREREILALLAQGLTNAAIAERQDRAQSRERYL